MSRVKKLFTTITLLVAVSIPSSVFATADSTLSQVIRDIDCTHTTLENGNQLNHPDCQIFAPKFMKLDLVDKKHPVLYGVYDAVHTVTNPITGQHNLTVEFNGRTFVLGRDSELRVNGNVWTLDFSNWQNDHPGDNFMPLTPGQVLASTGISMWLMIAISATAIFVASILLLVHKKEKERDG